jgi:SAM-dependent methyltransferase
MSTTTPDLSAIGTKHRALWASGDYPTVAADLIPGLGATLVEAAGITAGQRVLDVGAGTGNAAIPAALRGADVVASDLTPELLTAGEQIAAARGAQLQWVEADAHALPFENGEFDAVLSCVGVMFAPFHERAAAELLRVCRPGGTIGLLSWTPEGFVGRLFATMKPFAPAPPPGASSGSCSATACGSCGRSGAPRRSPSRTRRRRSGSGGSGTTGPPSPSTGASMPPAPPSSMPRSSTCSTRRRPTARGRRNIFW